MTSQPLSALQESELFDFYKDIELGSLVFWIANSLPSKVRTLSNVEKAGCHHIEEKLSIKGISSQR